MSRPVICIKPKFYDETPEERDKLNLKYVNSYCDLCLKECEDGRWDREQRREVTPEHLKMWNYEFPQFFDKDNTVSALITWHLAHIYLSNTYTADVRPAKWIHDLAYEDQKIKVLQTKV